MNNNKLPYSLNNMAPLFRSEESGSSCKIYEIQSPLYLSVRRENFLHMGIGNPLDPLDFESISKEIIVITNDVIPSLASVIPTTITQPITIYPCENIPEGVPAFASLTACRVIAGGPFQVVVYSTKLNQAFNISDDFVGLDQIVEYFAHNSILPPKEDFDIDIDLKNGTYESINYTGYTDLRFVLDNPDGDPNGPGTYIFTVVPEVRIKYIHEPS